MSKFLITGGAGFIGTNITRHLLKLGHQVRVLDNLSTGSISNLSDILDKIDFIKADVLDDIKVQRACQEIDFVLHHAAWRAIGRSVDNPLAAHAINATGTLNVLSAAKSATVKKFVFASSSAVYGDSNTLPSCESDLPAPASPYAAAKLASEHYCAVFSKIYNLPTISLRYFNVYGPYSRPESQYSLVIPIFLDQLLHRQRPEIHGSGQQSRDFIHASDVAQANLLAATSPRVKDGSVYNIGSGTSTSINDILNILQKIIGTSVSPTFSPRRSGDVFTTRADITQSRQQLNFKPVISFPEGLASSIDWYQHSFNSSISQPS